MATRWASVLTVLVLAPWFAEMSWGGYPVTDLPLILLFLSPLYGAAAVLIREAARRTGRGWPMIILLATAFGVLQAGLVDQSLFNPAYDRYDFQHPAHLAGIDVSLYYLVAFVTGHVVSSICAPIMVAECWSRRSHDPWLSRGAIWALAAVYVLGALVNHVGVKEEEGHGFQAAAGQTGSAVATICVLVASAMLWRRRSAMASRVPAPWVLAVLGFVAYLFYLPAESTAAVFVGIGVITIAVVVVGSWSRSTRWRTQHTVALGLGSILVGTVLPFWSEPYDPGVSASRELTNDLLAAALCLTVVVATLVRRRTIVARTSG